MATKQTRVNKQDVIGKFASSANDTGSPAVQIALLTERINNLADHLKSHPSDNSSRKGLLSLVGRRRRMEQYMQRTTGSKAVKDLRRKLGLE